MIMSPSFPVVYFFAYCIVSSDILFELVALLLYIQEVSSVNLSQQTSCSGFPKSLQTYARILPQIRHSSLFLHPVIIIVPLSVTQYELLKASLSKIWMCQITGGSHSPFCGSATCALLEESSAIAVITIIYQQCNNPPCIIHYLQLGRYIYADFDISARIPFCERWSVYNVTAHS